MIPTLHGGGWEGVKVISWYLESSLLYVKEKEFVLRTAGIYILDKSLQQQQQSAEQNHFYSREHLQCWACSLLTNVNIRQIQTCQKFKIRQIWERQQKLADQNHICCDTHFLKCKWKGNRKCAKVIEKLGKWDDLSCATPLYPCSSWPAAKLPVEIFNAVTISKEEYSLLDRIEKGCIRFYSDIWTENWRLRFLLSFFPNLFTSAFLRFPTCVLETTVSAGCPLGVFVSWLCNVADLN